MIKIISFIFIAVFVPLDAWAHSGGTNADGCHTNRKTGEYHCHNKKLKSTQAEKIESASEVGNRAMPSNEKPSGPQNKNRVFQWVDAKGEVHYSNNIEDLPVNARESLNLK